MKNNYNVTPRESKTILLSPGYSGFEKVAYIFLRLVCLTFTCAVLPLALYYIQTHRVLQNISGYFQWLIALGATTWTLMYIVLSQFRFPENLRGALFTAIGLVGNGVVGANLGDFDVAYGGYSAFWCSITAQTIFFSASALISQIKPLRDKYLAGLPTWYTFVLLVFAASLIALDS